MYINEYYEEVIEELHNHPIAMPKDRTLDEAIGKACGFIGIGCSIMCGVMGRVEDEQLEQHLLNALKDYVRENMNSEH